MRLRPFVLVVVAALLVCASAGAATLEVENENESGPGSLGQTILEAGPGDTILLGPGTYPLTRARRCSPRRTRSAAPGWH